MSPYRKVETRTYGDAKFQKLTAAQPCGQFLWLWLLTGPATCIIPGVIRMGPAGMAEMLGWPLKGFREAFQEILAQRLIDADSSAHLAFIPNAIKHNPPQSPNVVRSWRGTWNDLPECPLKLEVWKTLGAFLVGMGDAFGQAFNEVCPKPYVNQEQEQEQQQKKKNAARSAPLSDPRHKVAFDNCYEAYAAKYGSNPTWGGREGKVLQRFLVEHASMGTEEITSRYVNFLHSTDRYHKEKHGSLCHLLSNFDAFADGPIMERMNGNGKTAVNAEQRTRENLIAAGLL